MRTFITRFTFLLFGVLLIGSLSAQNLYITGGSYFDVESGEMIKNQGIVVRSGKFVRVNEPLNSTEGYELLQLSDADSANARASTTRY